VTAPACGSCGAPVSDASICQGCTRDLAELLLTAASIATDLDDAVARLLKRGNGGPRSDTEAPLPVDLGASEVADRLHRSLAYWARELWRPPMPWPGSRTDVLANWLAIRVGLIRKRHTAPRVLSELRATVRDALAVIDRKPERAPAGQCEACGAQLLAELGADEVTCHCGTVTFALEDKRRERAAAADVLGTAVEISAVLQTLGIHVPRGTITSWASRGRLGARGKSGMYALSDVLALHAQSQARVRG
jgi:hypothetical protein